jgi:hypothetical protein
VKRVGLVSVHCRSNYRRNDDQAQQRTRLLCLIGMWSVPVFSMHGDEPGGIEDKLTYYCA